MAMRPDVLLADEPTGELDSDNAGAIFGLFRQMVDSESMTIVATTHDRTLLDLADDIYRFHDGQLALTELGLVRRAPEIRASSEHAARASAINPFAAIAMPAEPPQEQEAAAEEPVAVRDERIVAVENQEEPETAEDKSEPVQEKDAPEEQVEPRDEDPREVDHAMFMRPKSE